MPKQLPSFVKKEKEQKYYTRFIAMWRLIAATPMRKVGYRFKTVSRFHQGTAGSIFSVVNTIYVFIQIGPQCKLAYVSYHRKEISE